jgi:hypothetical protein
MVGVQTSSKSMNDRPLSRVSGQTTNGRYVSGCSLAHWFGRMAAFQIPVPETGHSASGPLADMGRS